MSIYHVSPINDTKPHITDTSSGGCPCNPTIKEENGDLIIVHNAWDGREAVEKAGIILCRKETRK